MRIPRLFIPEKSLEEQVKVLMVSKKKRDSKRVGELLSVCESLSQTGEWRESTLYSTAADIAKMLNYNLEDLEEMSKLLKPGNNPKRGYFISALANMKLKEDSSLTLTLYEKLSGLGMYMTRGSMVIEGDVEDFTGFEMAGGSIRIIGSAGNDTGTRMIAGTIIIEGHAKGRTGRHMHGGKILVKGDSGDSTAAYMRGGELKVEGNTGKDLGSSMNNGAITVEGLAGDYAGVSMEGGRLTVYKGIGDNSFYHMKGGEALIKGDAGSNICDSAEGGKITILGKAESYGRGSCRIINKRGKLIRAG